MICGFLMLWFSDGVWHLLLGIGMLVFGIDFARFVAAQRAELDGS
jgi:hypothetical protein